MAVYKDQKRGTWYVKYSVPDAITGKRKQALKRGFQTKREALEFESKQRLSKDPRSDITFEELSERYFDYRKQKPQTRQKQTVILQMYTDFRKPVAKLTKGDLMEWYLWLDRTDLKPVTKNLVLTIVKSIFKYGADFYDLPNPSAPLRRFKMPKKEMQTWTPEQFDQFIRCVDLNHFKNLFIFLYMTGCRRGEALGLRYDDFDGVRCHIRGTKTDTSDRWIILPDALRARLEPVLAQCSKTRPFVFGGENRLADATVTRCWARSIKEAGVPRIRIHDLRHSFASNAIASGANIVAVSKYLGHASINITMSTYAHLLEQSESDLVERMNILYQKGITSV